LPGCAVGDVTVKPALTPTGSTRRGEVRDFAAAVLALEQRKDSVVERYQNLTRNIMDMRTRDVFAAVHALFAIAYRTELDGYELLSSSVRAGDPTGLQASLSDLLKADISIRRHTSN